MTNDVRCEVGSRLGASAFPPRPMGLTSTTPHALPARSRSHHQKCRLLARSSRSSCPTWPACHRRRRPRSGRRHSQRSRARPRTQRRAQTHSCSSRCTWYSRPRRQTRPRARRAWTWWCSCRTGKARRDRLQTTSRSTGSPRLRRCSPSPERAGGSTWCVVLRVYARAQPWRHAGKGILDTPVGVVVTATDDHGILRTDDRLLELNGTEFTSGDRCVSARLLRRPLCVPP